MFSYEEIANYHCPRWNDWPDLGLYMDQVTRLLEEYVAGFSPADLSKHVTSTMINNYVKRKIVMPSKNKLYNREHLAHLYILFLLKPVLSLSEICDALTQLTKDSTFPAVYDRFCNAIEQALAQAFYKNGEQKVKIGETDEIMVALSLAFAYSMLTKLYLNKNIILSDK
ncbi:MAG: DUF1836 domain-containing protein [Firmicutes bacterium]|nr:DUF1836 domain-containing protein [Bacillota bacterium]